MSKEIIVVGNIEFEKRKFHHCKNLILLEDVDIDNILKSGMVVSFGDKNYKYFISHKRDQYKIKTLHIMLPKTGTCVKSYDGGETKRMNFLFKDDDLLKKNNDLWNKVSNSIKKELDCKPSDIKSFLEIKIRPYRDKTTNFHARKKPEVDSNRICCSLIFIDSVLKKD